MNNIEFGKQGNVTLNQAKKLDKQISYLNIQSKSDEVSFTSNQEGKTKKNNTNWLMIGSLAALGAVSLIFHKQIGSFFNRLLGKAGSVKNEIDPALAAIKAKDDKIMALIDKLNKKLGSEGLSDHKKARLNAKIGALYNRHSNSLNSLLAMDAYNKSSNLYEKAGDKIGQALNRIGTAKMPNGADNLIGSMAKEFEKQGYTSAKLMLSTITPEDIAKYKAEKLYRNPEKLVDKLKSFVSKEIEKIQAELCK